MPALPKISVVTPSFNSMHTIRETIESVLAQNYPDVEHIVMDGGSKDATLDILKEYPHLKWVSEKDEGHYHAMNKGILASTGEYIEILNSDDCLRPGALHTVGKALAEHPEWDAVFGDIVYVNANGEEIYRREEAKWDYDVMRCGICYVIHPTLFVKRTVYDRIGLYDYKRFLNACDYAFELELGRTGCKVGHVNALLVNYRYHQFGQSADRRVTDNTLRESLIIRKEHGVPGGISGKALGAYYRLVRQAQKLRYRGFCDIIPGGLILRKHMQQSTSFTSNIPQEKFSAGASK